MPSTKVVPAFMAVEPVTPPTEWGDCLDAQTMGVLAASNQFTVRQHMKLRELIMGGCVWQPNTYTIYAGLSDDSAGELFRVQEVSDNCSRCCCHPCHPLKLEVKAHRSMPRGAGQSAELADLERQMGMGLCGSGFIMNPNMQARSLLVEQSRRELQRYAAQPALFTVVRNGYRCLLCRGCKDHCCCKDEEGDSAGRFIPKNDALVGGQHYVGCGACHTNCLDGMTMVAGDTAEESTLMIGEVPAPAEARVIGSADQPLMGGGFTPTIDINDGPVKSRQHGGMGPASSKMTGPTCFGGCLDFCCDFQYPVSSLGADGRVMQVGDVCLVVKRKPRNMVGAMRELLSNADVYTVEFVTPNVPVQKKATILGSTLLLDYMLYEQREQDKCGPTDDGKGFYINLCNCFCLGCICPCRIVLKNNNN